MNTPIQNPDPAAQTNDPSLPITPAPEPVSATPVLELRSPDAPSAPSADSTSATAASDPSPRPGTPPCDQLELSSTQITALEALAAGQSLADAARWAGVNPGTIYRWKKNDPRFIAALNAWRAEALAGARDRLLALTDEATRAAYRLLRKDNASVTVAILKSLGPARNRAGATDASEIADTLRWEQRQREDDRRSRLHEEAFTIRRDTEYVILKKENNRKRLEETAALTGELPESVLREYRRADQLMVEADGLPNEEDRLPGGEEGKGEP